MTSLKNLLEEIESPKQPEAEKTAAFTIDDLEQTNKSLEKLASQDREIDVMAKLAILTDMGMDKEAFFGMLKSPILGGVKALNKEEKLYEAAKFYNKAALKAKDTAKLEEITRKIEAGGKTLGDYKGVIGAGALALGTFHLGGSMSEGNRKDELKRIAQKYYLKGRQSTGGQ